MGCAGRRRSRRIDEAIQAKAVRYRKPPEWSAYAPPYSGEPFAQPPPLVEVLKRATGRVDHRSGPVEESSAEAEGGAHWAPAAELLWRVGPRGHLRSRLAGRGRGRGALPGADDRRGNQPELGAVGVWHDGTRENAWGCFRNSGSA